MGNNNSNPSGSSSSPDYNPPALRPTKEVELYG